MNLNDFVSMINALAWPTATLGLALLFREEVKSMLGRIGRVKYRDVEVTFREDLRQAESLARSIPSQGRVILEADSTGLVASPQGEIIGDRRPALARHPEQDRIERMAAQSPLDAMIEAWSVVGQSLMKAASNLGDRRAPAPLRPEDASRYLVDRGWLVGPEAHLVERLRMIRDRLVQGDLLTPTPDEARRFVNLAFPLASRIEALG
ncbi:hypothetical protein P12x_004620 [Tundrisphaera lichenicola]|uniref:hypothetical protein n=1 Tax=Tundrisphaera lichenicola TaxID=2029860 RepID=UPI003EBB3F44